jgi:hypothetical protein
MNKAEKIGAVAMGAALFGALFFIIYNALFSRSAAVSYDVPGGFEAEEDFSEDELSEEDFSAPPAEVPAEAPR